MSTRKSPKNKDIGENWGRCGTDLSSLVSSATLVTHNSAISRPPIYGHVTHLRSSTDSRPFFYVQTRKG